MLKTIRRLVKNESGATAIEYGLIAALISIAAITAMTTVGTELTNQFNTVQQSLAGSQDGAGAGAGDAGAGAGDAGAGAGAAPE